MRQRSIKQITKHSSKHINCAWLLIYRFPYLWHPACTHAPYHLITSSHKNKALPLVTEFLPRYRWMELVGDMTLRKLSSIKFVITNRAAVRAELNSKCSSGARGTSMEYAIEKRRRDTSSLWWYRKAYLLSCTSSYVELYRDSIFSPFSAVSIPTTYRLEQHSEWQGGCRGNVEEKRVIQEVNER